MSAKPWHADIEVTEQLVIACVGAQFPELLPFKSVKFLGSGWDNNVYLINNKIVFRFPRRKISVELLERENIVLPNLTDKFALQIPNVQYIGETTDLYPYCFQGYNIIPGNPSYLTNLHLEERIASIEPLAKFLKKLHSINAVVAADFGARQQVFDRLNRGLLVKKLTERVTAIINNNICKINKKYISKMIALIKTVDLSSEDDCLVHGDLYFRHLLFDEHHKLTGIIDWGDVGINNPAVDLAVVHSFYPKSCHNAFFKHYGAVSNDIWQYAEALGFYSTLSVMVYAHDIGDQALLNEAIQSVLLIADCGS